MEHSMADSMSTPSMRQAPPQHFGNGGVNGFQTSYSAFLNDATARHLGILPVSDRQQVVYNLSPSIDVDQGLSNMLSSLNLSQNGYNYTGNFLPESLEPEIGGVSSPIGIGEGFINPFLSNARSAGLEQSLWGLNAVNNQQGIYSGVGHATPVTVDPHHPLLYYTGRNDHNSGYYLPPASCSSGFDQWSDFDPRTDLFRKKHLYAIQKFNSHNPCSSAAVVDESLLSHRHGCPSCNHNNLNLRFKNLNHTCGLPTKLQNYQALSFMTLEELRGKIVCLAKDQNGSKILQAKFENPTKEEIELVLSEVVECISELMKDQFGNYLVQKLVPLCNDDQKDEILLWLTEPPINIILVCMSPHGTRSIQKLLENLTARHQIEVMMAALRPGAATLANDPNGHHVIQHCLVHFPFELNKLIVNEIAAKCYKVATDRSGCCVLQACVEHSRGEVRNRLVTEIIANAMQLAEDPFGNYVLQHMLTQKVPESTAELVRQLQGNFASLSRNKYASNVVEKCLNEARDDMVTMIVLELVGSPNPSLLLVDPYANFVIQCALRVSKGFAHDCLRDLISQNISSMRSNLYGKKILEWFEKRRILLF